MIEFKHLSAGYGKDLIIQDIDLKIPSNTITTIIGPNGSGKSTLIKSFFNFCNIRNGDLMIDQQSILHIHSKELAKKVFYFSQHHNNPSITVAKMVLHGRFPHIHYPRTYTSSDLSICDEAMRRAGVFEFRNKMMSELSGGEQQKVYLAMVFAGQTDILLLDEPTTYLDITCQLELFHTMQSLKQEGRTILAVLHDINYALNLSDQIIVMNNGKVQAYGTPDDIYSSQILSQVFHIQLKKAIDQDGCSHYVFDRC
jgi:iron complex transport system ATP-binding protein